MNFKILPKMIQTMRKTVVDGSNTSGFQRTSLISTGGLLETKEGQVGVEVLCLEEDSARKLDTIDVQGGQQVLYNLDRLGLPLIEIATSPDVQTPEHAKSTAIALGRILRQTRRVRRGLGSIRQDLNVSIGAGDRVEIMDLVRTAMNREVASLGIEVLDVRLKRVDLDPGISERVYQRMEAERSRVAMDLRARGAEAAEVIRADADRQRAIIIAEAQQTAQEVKGQGDAEATSIYADAFSRDREFYQMYRSLNAYRKTFASPDNLLVVEPDSEFFKYFNQAKPGPSQ